MALTKTPQEIVTNSSNPLLNIHKSWERVLLKEVASVLNGLALKSKQFNKEQKGTPVIRIRDVGQKFTGTYYDGEWDSKYRIVKGDLLIGMDGDFRRAIWNNFDAILNQRVCKVENIISKYDSQFLFYVLQPYLDAIHAEIFIYNC